MNLADVERMLPNGLHEAVLRGYTVDYENRTAIFSFDVWIGDLNAGSDEDSERHRAGTLVLTGVEYVAAEPRTHGRSLSRAPMNPTPEMSRRLRLRLPNRCRRLQRGSSGLTFSWTQLKRSFTCALLRQGLPMTPNHRRQADAASARRFSSGPVARAAEPGR